MFDRLKQLNNLRQMQKTAEAERATAEHEGVRVTLNGKLEVVELSLNPALAVARQEELLKRCFNEAGTAAQMALAKKLSGMF